MTVNPEPDYVEELCETFYTAFVETQRALGALNDDYEFGNWFDLPNDVKEPIRMSVRTVIEYIQTDLGALTNADEIAKEQIADHLGKTEEEYEIKITEKDQGFLKFLGGGKDD